MKKICKNLAILFTLIWFFGGWFWLYIQTNTYLASLPLVFSVILTIAYFIASLLLPIVIWGWILRRKDQYDVKNKMLYLQTYDPNDEWIESLKELVGQLSKDHEYERIKQDLVPLVRKVDASLSEELKGVLEQAISYQASYSDRWSGGWGFSSEYQEKITELLDDFKLDSMPS